VTDLGEQMRELIETGARPVSLGEIMTRAYAPAPARPPARARYRVRPGWATAVIAGTAAAALAGAMIAGQLTGASRPAAPRYGALLTAAQVRHLTVASRAALARSARALITYEGPAPYHPFQYEYVLFSGQNYSFAGSVINPAIGGRPGQIAWFAERVVNGQAYDHELVGKVWHWFHYAGAGRGKVAATLNPRLLLGLLAPSERFRFAGRVVAGGVPLERLQATEPAKAPDLSALAGVPAGQSATALEVLVDRHGVVRRVDISVRGATLTAAAGVKRPAAGKGSLAGQESMPYAVAGPTTLTVTFADIGQPQSIIAPPHAINVGAPWGARGHPLPPPVSLPASVAGS
jgi:hypothetical protein